MEPSTDCRLARDLAQSIRASRRDLVKRWLERITDRVALPPDLVFPTEELLDHVPLLMDGIADYLADPADEITADVPVVAKAHELGELRHQQGFEAAQILKEYELLGGILFDHLEHEARALQSPAPPDDVLVCAHRLFRAVSVIQQYTTAHFLRLADERVAEREERLRSFGRTVSHELKNRIGAIQGANELLGMDGVGDDARQRERFTGIIEHNVTHVKTVLSDLTELSRIDAAEGPGRNVLLSDAAREVVRQLRDFADARQVEVRLADDLPAVEVPGAAAELCLSNYISNAVKYRDRTRSPSWVRVEGEVVDGAGEGGACEVVVRVRDNGLGVPAEAREGLFNRFFRAHEETVTGEEGTGLGLAIVRETMEAVGGRAWAEFADEHGSTFALAFPCVDAPAPEAAGGPESG
jgi:signal transduction histidine kinase